MQLYTLSDKAEKHSSFNKAVSLTALLSTRELSNPEPLQSILHVPSARSHPVSCGAYPLSNESVPVVTKWEGNPQPSLSLRGWVLSALHEFTDRYEGSHWLLCRKWWKKQGISRSSAHPLLERRYGYCWSNTNTQIWAAIFSEVKRQILWANQIYISSQSHVIPVKLKSWHGINADL